MFLLSRCFIGGLFKSLPLTVNSATVAIGSNKHIIWQKKRQLSCDPLLCHGISDMNRESLENIADTQIKFIRHRALFCAKVAIVGFYDNVGNRFVFHAKLKNFPI